MGDITVARDENKPEDVIKADGSKENPFVSDGELCQKADYIIRHSIISRTEIRIVDPDVAPVTADSIAINDTDDVVIASVASDALASPVEAETNAKLNSNHGNHANHSDNPATENGQITSSKKTVDLNVDKAYKSVDKADTNVDKADINVDKADKVKGKCCSVQ